MDEKLVKIKVVYNNKRATFDYEILERFEAGLALTLSLIHISEPTRPY